MHSNSYIFTGFLSCKYLKPAHAIRDKHDHVQEVLGIQGQPIAYTLKCITYSLRQIRAIKLMLLENIQIPPGSTQ